MKTPKRHINRSYNYNKIQDIVASAQSHEIIFNPLNDDQIKISQLPESSRLDGSDLLPIVDISGEALATKKITLSNFIESTFNTSISPSGDNIKFTFRDNILYIHTAPTGYFADLYITNKSGSGAVVFDTNPILTGIPTAPTANSGTNTKQIANTEFVRTEIANLIDFAPDALDTLNELAAAIANDPNYSVTIVNQLATKANLSGASFSGTITSPTGDFVVLKQNGLDVSVGGHSHSSNDITDFNSSVSGLLPSKYPTVVQLGSVSGTINTNASLGDIFDLTLMASGTLANPTNPTDGQSVRWRISHGASGLILNFGDQFRIPSSATSPLPVSSTSGSMDILDASYDGRRAKWDIVTFVPSY